MKELLERLELEVKFNGYSPYYQISKNDMNKVIEIIKEQIALENIDDLFHNIGYKLEPISEDEDKWIGWE